MGKVVILGVGNVGSALAHALIVSGLVHTLVLIDKNEQKAMADSLDFQDAMANLNHYTTIITNDYDQLNSADVIVSTLGDISLQLNEENDRFAELTVTYPAVLEVGAKIKQSGFSGVLVTVSNPVDVITTLYQEVTGLPKNQVIGTGTLLDTGRMKRALAQKLKIDPRSITGYNLGEHGNSQFTAWSTVKALGKGSRQLATDHNLNLFEIDQESKEGGHRVFLGKKYTNYGIAAATMNIIEAILHDSRTEFPVSNYYSSLQTYLGYPAIIGRRGVVEEIQLDLLPEEEEKLWQSAQFIKEKFEQFSTKYSTNR